MPIENERRSNCRTSGMENETFAWRVTTNGFNPMVTVYYVFEDYAFV